MNSIDDREPVIRLTTVTEVGVQLGISRSHAYVLVMSGRISSVKIGRCRRVSAEALAAFVRELEVAA